MQLSDWIYWHGKTMELCICICPMWLELLFHAKFCVGKECICLVLYLYAKEIWNAILFEIKLFGMSLVWERVYVNGKITLWIFYEILIDVCLVVDSRNPRVRYICHIFCSYTYGKMHVNKRWTRLVLDQLQLVFWN